MVEADRARAEQQQRARHEEHDGPLEPSHVGFSILVVSHRRSSQHVAHIGYVLLMVAFVTRFTAAPSRQLAS